MGNCHISRFRECDGNSIPFAYFDRPFSEAGRTGRYSSSWRGARK
ncbi:hypothetical protein AG1IA_07366 [Rhizoctonia solani AG-1 IA]|uniref:Uncharacterized protein n=1 Tax=Thanatephorus cucumeris (strain AG1-IA) TaxID=983506 RepID=L8WP98_THACA|nr:hypothetical protein AG1IA_07366 [Rhizoctonia solani AG-1 IA]